MNAKRQTVSLVLGSGGARGLAHIGAIRCLEERGYDIRYVAGSSMGALIGGIHAAGKLHIYEQWVTQLHASDVLRLLDWSFSRGSLFKGEKIIEVLKKMIGSRNIEDLPIGFTAVATDLNSEREVWFTRGPLFDAIRASMAAPMVFAPVDTGRQLLVDGGLANPLPIAPTLNDNTDLTIAVDLNGRREHLEEDRDPHGSDDDDNAGYRERIARFLDGLVPDMTHAGMNDAPGAFDLMMRSMDTVQGTITRFKLAGYGANMVVRIPRNLCGFFDFHRARELIRFGSRRMAETLDRHRY